MLNQLLKTTAFIGLISLAPNPLLAFQTVIAQTESESGGDSVEHKPKLTDLWQPGDTGQRMNIRGRVTSIDGTPLDSAQISIRQADGAGEYHYQYTASLVSDDKGRFQFGSVVPGNYLGAKHVHVTVYAKGFEYLDTNILFEGDPNLDAHYADGKAIFLEESTVDGKTILFGRFDIELSPK